MKTLGESTIPNALLMASGITFNITNALPIVSEIAPNITDTLLMTSEKWMPILDAMHVGLHARIGVLFLDAMQLTSGKAEDIEDGISRRSDNVKMEIDDEEGVVAILALLEEREELHEKLDVMPILEAKGKAKQVSFNELVEVLEQEIKAISSIENDATPLPKNLRKSTTSKAKKVTIGTLRSDEVQTNQDNAIAKGEEVATIPKIKIDKIIKVEKEVCMDVVQKFYDVDYHSSVFYTIVEGKRVYFEEEAIKKLYKFPVVRMKG
ncbi:hypothetical protein E5676_scaffold155G00950 [Cucumis melo var. makuwa]|uniref:Uncharacterized protein n=1 Tax=Cucumis melo var. makuwa TaxID=1194695 RepID=A0A5A7U0J6_CUCMM|nr:hypothetical protein E6C27_scaffold1059G00170 [Cucumis melo var. makuwa]TYK02390.1 hypothetical protein E5676_scaffold155G00950 [Cucumis melo var. makuwa]